MDPYSVLWTSFAILSPYLKETAKKLAGSLAEDIYEPIKSVFIKSEDSESLNVLDRGANSNISNKELASIRDKFEEGATQEDIEKLKLVLDQIPDSKMAKINNIVLVMSNLQKDLVDLYDGYSNAGIGTKGDYINRIKIQEKKVDTLENEILVLIEDL